MIYTLRILQEYRGIAKVRQTHGRSSHYTHTHAYTLHSSHTNIAPTSSRMERVRRSERGIQAQARVPHVRTSAMTRSSENEVNVSSQRHELDEDFVDRPPVDLTYMV